MKQEDSEQQQSRGMINAQAGNKQVDGPDDPVVNEEEQNKAVNPEDEEYQVQTKDSEEKKGYSENKDTDNNKNSKNETGR